MSNANDLGIIRTVSNLMALRGGDNILQVVEESDYDPNTSTTSRIIINVPIRTLVFDYLQKLSGISTQSSLVKSGDKQVFIKPAEGVKLPDARKDMIVLNGVTFSIITVKDLNPSGTKSYLYELFVRQ